MEISTDKIMEYLSNKEYRERGEAFADELLEDFVVKSRVVRYVLRSKCEQVKVFGTLTVIYKDGRYAIGLSKYRDGDPMDKELGAYISAVRAYRAYVGGVLMNQEIRLNALEPLARCTFENAIKESLYEMVSTVMKESH